MITGRLLTHQLGWSHGIDQGGLSTAPIAAVTRLTMDEAVQAKGAGEQLEPLADQGQQVADLEHVEVEQ